MYKTLVEAVLDHAENRADIMALAFKSETLSYQQLGKRVISIAGILSQRFGIRAGDLVMLSAVSKPEYIAAFLGIQYLGAVSVPVDKSIKRQSLEKLTAFMEPKLLLTDIVSDQELFPGVCLHSLKELYAMAGQEEEAAPAYEIPKEEETCEILFTTGTTGDPKGAMLSGLNVLTSTLFTVDGIGMRSDDVILVPLPLHHSFGMRVVRATLYLGATLVLQNGFTFAKNIEENITRYHCSAMVSAAASIKLLEQQMGERFVPVMGRLRYMEFSAGSLTLDQRRRLVESLPGTTIHNTWGSTETGGALFLNVSENPSKIGSIGKPIEGVKMQAVDGQGNPVQAVDVNTAGRMRLQGPMQMQGYYHLPEVNEKTLKDGWLLTNDMVYTDEDGYIYMLAE